MIERRHWHPDLTDAVIIEAARRHSYDLDDPGFCIMCGHEQGGCEPDARRYKCESCGAKQVYGAEELAFNLDSENAVAALWPTGSGDSD
jgi:hypothetical protein